MKIRFFAALKDHFGEEITLTEPAPATVAELSEMLIQKRPGAKDLLKTCRFAVNNTFVNPDTCVEEKNEVLVMPPSSGG